MNRTTTPEFFTEKKSSSEQPVSEKAAPETPSEPRPHVIKNILSYSKALKVEKSNDIGTVENVMN